ncbi:MAG: hypothetical protein M0R03_14340 [Novosphingobium sp.]|nr:hypothetical protein [Novosphingobium sp.]
MANTAPITGAPSCAPITYDTIALFCDRNGMTLSRFGREAAGDPGLVFAIRDGRAIRPATAAKINAYISGSGSMHVRRVPSGRRTRHADDFAMVARRHRAEMREGCAMLLAAIQRERGEA